MLVIPYRGSGRVQVIHDLMWRVDTDIRRPVEVVRILLDVSGPQRRFEADPPSNRMLICRRRGSVPSVDDVEPLAFRCGPSPMLPARRGVRTRRRSAGRYPRMPIGIRPTYPF